MRKLVWFSCGAASANVAKIAVQKYPDCEVLYCDTFKYEHPDNRRFFKDVEKWIGKKIKIIKSEKYTDIFDVFNAGWLIGPHGAMCTRELKRKVRKKYQQKGDLHIFGLTSDEEDRIEDFEDNNLDIDLEWMLLDKGITKDNCYSNLVHAEIELPAMYKLGYNNNNCLGCVKGGSGYWNKIRIDFPESFKRMEKMERKLGIAINKSYAKRVKLIDGTIIDNPKNERVRIFLDELHPESGRDVPMPNIECGVLCINENMMEDATEQFQMRFA